MVCTLWLNGTLYKPNTYGTMAFIGHQSSSLCGTIYQNDCNENYVQLIFVCDVELYQGQHNSSKNQYNIDEVDHMVSALFTVNWGDFGQREDFGQFFNISVLSLYKEFLDEMFVIVKFTNLHDMITSL